MTSTPRSPSRRSASNLPWTWTVESCQVPAQRALATPGGRMIQGLELDERAGTITKYSEENVLHSLRPQSFATRSRRIVSEEHGQTEGPGRSAAMTEAGESGEHTSLQARTDLSGAFGYDLAFPRRILVPDLPSRRIWLTPIGAAFDLFRCVARRRAARGRGEIR
jgi:hypothetical protein